MLAALTHPGHIVIYAPGDSLPCRLAATRNLLGIYVVFRIICPFPVSIIPNLNKQKIMVQFFKLHIYCAIRGALSLFSQLIMTVNHPFN
ncbi:hypothetical protein CKY04_04330 [Photorhabdus sp. S8-52]|nr:hypothetical protein CKY03_05310 [Photorhabdus sp. S9-53]RAX02405.1 hypothetical protein CKY05_04335 [Photorhabdus sp. S10-54]RAX05444.1 hypothetical protein CKY04_04330 [Photorhabdus sp. S8-52]